MKIDMHYIHDEKRPSYRCFRLEIIRDDGTSELIPIHAIAAVALAGFVQSKRHLLDVPLNDTRAAADGK